MSSPKGYVLHEGMVNGQAIVTIATAHSSNIKTGNMVQIWILLRDSSPVGAVQTGQAARSICEGCRFATDPDDPEKNGGCYVEVGRAPAAVWKAYKRGCYEYMLPRMTDYKAAFGGRKIRFGAYGNPSLIPLHIIERVAEASSGWTGYFHDWHQMAPERAKAYGRYFMASTETAASYIEAKRLGLRVFHASPETFTEDGCLIKTTPTLLLCPNVTHGIECIKCGLCNGTTGGGRDIRIPPHGSQKRKAEEVALS